MGKRGFDIDCKPSKDRKKVTLTITSKEVLGVHEMINALAYFIKHQVETNGIDYSDVAVKPEDKVTLKAQEAKQDE